MIEKAIADAKFSAQAQAAEIARGLEEQGLPDIRDKKIVALIAYLQRLGRGPQPVAPELATGGN